MNNEQQTKVLITGAGGLVGSHLIKALAGCGETVRAVYHSSEPRLKSDKIEWIKGDVLDIPFLEDAMTGVEQVYHCAAVVSFDPREKKLLHKTNIEGTANVVNTCLDKGVKKLVHLSSVSALGRLRKNEWITEESRWSEETNNSEYGRTKFLAEMEVWRGIGEGLDAVIVNPTIILGPADWNKGSSAIFKNAYEQFPWYSEGVTGFVDVEDVVKVMIALMKSDVAAERFIVSAENLSYRALFDMIAKAFHKNQPYKKVTPLIAALVWRTEALKSLFTKKRPLVTRETARTAQARVYFDNSKLLKFLPGFGYESLDKTVERICTEYKRMYSLV